VPAPAETVVARGPRATEDLLLARVEALCKAAREDPRQLAQPVRVVVPSGALRKHVAARLAAERAVAGVAVQTLHALAIEVAERAALEVPAGDPLVDLLARRLAPEERSLRAAFEPFDRGYRPVGAAVRDLLDAGFEPHQLEAALEAAAEAALPRDERERTAGVVRTAARVAEELAARGLGGRGELLARATRALRAGEVELPTRHLFVHGFADLTGRAADLLEALAGALPTTILVDHPADPVDPEREDLGVRYTARLRDRLSGVAPLTLHEEVPALPARALFEAPGAEAEVREVARRARLALDEEGVAPERIGIVARDLSEYVVAVRTQLGRLGIPYSAGRARAPLDGPARRVLALLELLEAGGRTTADRWLDATALVTYEQEGKRSAFRPSAELRLALRVVGAGRLADVAEVEVEGLLRRGRLDLPVRGDVQRGEHGLFASRMKLDGARLLGAVKAAASAARRLGGWRGRAPLGWHLEELGRLRRQDLGWRSGDEAEDRLIAQLEPLREGLGDEPLRLDEFTTLLRGALASAVAPPLGGAGAGVQVLDAMEARGRTFERLFLVGLNRDLFPRSPGDDPLMPDGARTALAALLPEMPIKARARDEDRYLFAQLVAAAPEVTVSWQVTGDDGKARVVSPLVERLKLAHPSQEVPAVLPLDPTAVGDHPRTAYEHALLAGLHGGRRELQPRLERALQEARVPHPEEVAAASWRTLDAVEAGSLEPLRYAPWLGFLGEQGEAGVLPDPRKDPLFVTRYEGLATCGWKSMLEQVLRIEAAPDPLDSLPTVEAFTLGVVVHGVLERIVRNALGDGAGDQLDLVDALRREPVTLEWPDPEQVEELLRVVAREEISQRRPATPGLVETCCALARPHLQHARDFLTAEARAFPEGGLLGAEVSGRAEVATPGGVVPILFRADRVERRGETVVVSDYKTGRPKDAGEVFLKGVPGGSDLQPIAYALAGEAAGEQTRGRYLFLKAEEAEDLPVELEDTETLVPALERTVGALVEAWLAGVFTPRVEDRKGTANGACKYCDVASACSKGESGARRALRAWIRGTVGEPTLEEPLAAAWTLGREEDA